MNLIEQFANVRRVSTPLVVIRTTDANAVMQQITKHEGSDTPIVQWDIAAGFVGRTKPAGVNAVAQMRPEDMPEDVPVTNPAAAMFWAAKAPADAIVFVINAHRVWGELNVVQGMWNLRDSFKGNHQTLVMLTTLEAKTPRELDSDTIVLDDPLPDGEQLEKIVREQCETARETHKGLVVPTGEMMARCVDALRGLSAFVAEQIVALALTKKGVSLPELWTRKKQAVEAVDGAKVYGGTEKFDSIGGLDGLKEALGMELRAKHPVKLVVIFDEFEKMIAGGTSDHVGDGGVAKDAVMKTLTFMQDYKVRGAVVYGHPGCAKSAVAKAMANEAGVLCIMADMGAMRGGIVGESEARIRAFFNLIAAIAGVNGAFFVATCNSTGAFTTEMRRRFKTGFFFVDLPSEAEKKAIWKIQMQRYGLKDQPLPDDTDWTGAEIEVCCEKADNYGLPLVKVARTITTIAKSQPELIAQRRKEAHNRLLSASTGETFSNGKTGGATPQAFVAPAPRDVRNMPES